MAVILLILFITLLVAPTPGSASFSNKHDLRQFNSGYDSVYEGNAGGKENDFVGHAYDCTDPDHDAWKHAEIKCSLNVGCRVKCTRGYRMNGIRALYLTCDFNTGNLTYNDVPWEKSLPPCLPHCKEGCLEGFHCASPDLCKISECDPPCQNGGSCIISGVCNCSQGYSGLLCDEHRCDIPSQWPEKASIAATPELTLMDIKCNRNHRMKSGTYLGKFRCHHHQWVSIGQGSPLKELDVNCYDQNSLTDSY